ncbi:MAG: tripartite tricarboxylate transporter permease [Candidatus Aenigmatarchaeota archaeon]
MFDVLLFTLLGVAIGTVAGLIPGLHPNLMATLFTGYLFFPPLQTSVLLVSAGVTNTFVNFIPAVYLGAPSSSTALSVLPGHKMLLEGRGREAIRLTVVGGLFSIVLISLLTPVLFSVVPKIYPLLENYIHYLLIAIVGYMFYQDRDLNAVLIFILAGTLGYIVLTMNFIGTPYDLFPLLAGLFGVSTLLHSLQKETRIPEEDRSLEHVGRRTALFGGLIGSVAGMIVGLLPGVGSAQATYVARELSGRDNIREFMISIGGVNTANIVLSLVAIYLIGKGRSGIAVAVSKIVEVTFETVVLFIPVIIFSAGMAAAVTVFLSRHSLKLFRKIDYHDLSTVVIFFLGLAALFLTGIRGLIVMAVAASVGFTCIVSGTRRSYLMASIIVPIIIFFL